MKPHALYGALLSLTLVRAESEYSSLYGYGIGIGGLPLTYADGIAYLGDAPSNASTATNVTVAIKSGIVAVKPTDETWSDSKSLYVNLQAGAYDAAKIASSAEGYTHTGFLFYGRTLFQSGSSGLSSLFYATPLNSQNTTYLLKWNSDSTDDGTSTPVALRTLPPS
ncbi:cytochrome p450 protein [Botryosphaeria dothidea]|uniref:Cytochrome p450 protein n=1 Tax=Botryosphaeria dothidea TaxID=55169 RepID=A0A8H4IXU2_9PEZI|nr:cytochrome p450 protein [Botryosphaeria dothidea]